MIIDSILDGRYKIIETLGSGGMSKVYLAENIKLGTLWAIKEINKKPDCGADIFIEPNILKKLSHPALPRIFDIMETDDYIYIVVDYIKGVPLCEELARVGRFTEEIVVNWANQICDVLNYLHSALPDPIIYRDMKPSNIILADDGTIKLIDFGIAREYKKGSGSDTVFIGTRGYAAPEQYGGGRTNASTDIYSLGVTLYHLLTGYGPNEPPYEIKPVRSINSDLSAAIERIIEKCTRQDPQERFQTMQEVVNELKKITDSDSDQDIHTVQDFDGVQDPDAVKAQNPKYISFKKLVVTVWDNAEFACELAYTAAKQTRFRILLADLDLLAPKVDIFLNVRKYSDKIFGGYRFDNSGLNLVMDAVEKNALTEEVLTKASVKRKELKNLFILTGNYKLENYEYYDNESLMMFIDKAYQYYDMTILAVNRSLYDSYTVVSLLKSDFNIIPVRADIDKLREFNRYLLFLKEKQNLALEKTKFIAFEYNPSTNLDRASIEETTEHNFLGSVRYSARRTRYRNLKAPYARRMDTAVRLDYMNILYKLGITPGLTLIDRLKQLLPLKRGGG